jgi:ribonucleoside-diphosphate reductase alpha chain
MVIERKSKKLGWKGELLKIRAEDVPQHNEARFILSSVNEDFSICELSPMERLNIAFQADGHKCMKVANATEFHFSKQRKIDRLESILVDTGLEYTKSNVSTDGSIKLYVKNYSGTKDFSWLDLKSISPTKANSILEEIAEWDAHRNREHSFVYSNTNKAACNIVQCLAVLAGRSSRLTELWRDDTRQNIFTVFVGNKPYFNLEKLIKKTVNYAGKVYCCVVPSGKIVVRNGGVPLVCGNTRRGSTAAYLDISHPDIVQFIEMRKPTGDPDLRTLNMNHGINITDKFMQIIERCMFDKDANDDWELIQPNTGKVVEVVSAKALWASIMDMRSHTGEPYLWFIDTANKGLPQYQKDLGLKIHGSNLCSEISLATSKDRTAVCCLSSVNAEYFDDWKDDALFIADILEMLDNVLTYFIDNAPDTIKRAKYSAFRERSVGVGLLGFHAYLQKCRVPFESAMAKSINIKLFKHIRTQLDIKNKELAKERGGCPDAVDAGILDVRCSHVMALAPNASSSIILGNTSPSAEMYPANIYTQDTISGAYTNKNKYLDRCIRAEVIMCNHGDAWYEEQWISITAHAGSVQHLEWMSAYDKGIFKTAREANQEWVIEHAADRQCFIDQGQSINFYVRPTIPIKDLHWLHYLAWKKGLKGVYYCRSGKMAKAEAVGKSVKRVRLEDEIDDSEYQSQNTENTSAKSSVSYINMEDPGGCLACE